MARVLTRRNGVKFMRIFGNFTGLDYQMEVNGVQVATVHKKWLSVRDQIGLSITGEAADHRVILGALIVRYFLTIIWRKI